MTAPQPPVATPPTATLGTLLDELEEWVAEAARLGAQGMSLSKAEGDALDAARAAVLEYVERLGAENEHDAANLAAEQTFTLGLMGELARLRSDVEENRALHDLLTDYGKENAALTADVERLQAERDALRILADNYYGQIAALQADALAPEEAEALTFAIKRSEVVFDTDETATYFGNGYLKLLRRIAATQFKGEKDA